MNLNLRLCDLHRVFPMGMAAGKFTWRSARQRPASFPNPFFVLSGCLCQGKHIIDRCTSLFQFNRLLAAGIFGSNDLAKKANDHKRTVSFGEAKIGNREIPIHPNQAGPDRREKR
jgi:hypothetical protein